MAKVEFYSWLNCYWNISAICISCSLAAAEATACQKWTWWRAVIPSGHDGICIMHFQRCYLMEREVVCGLVVRARMKPPLTLPAFQHECVGPPLGQHSVHGLRKCWLGSKPRPFCVSESAYSPWRLHGDVNAGREGGGVVNLCLDKLPGWTDGQMSRNGSWVLKAAPCVLFTCCICPMVHTSQSIHPNE